MYTAYVLCTLFSCDVNSFLYEYMDMDFVRMTLTDLGWLSEIFSDMMHRAVSLSLSRQLS